MKLEEFSINAAESYLQTAVFVDDEIYEKSTKKFEKSSSPTKKPRKLASKKAVKVVKLPRKLTPPQEAELNSLSSYDLLNSFAKKRIVCSLYEPQKGQKYTQKSEAYLLCLSADIVIVDWVIHDQRGEHTLELIENLIKQSVEDEPEQLRLILVYTGEINLFEISERVFERIPSDFDPTVKEDGLVIETANARIVVLGKPGRERATRYKDFVVDGKDLANRAIAEFAKIADGLLQGIVLQGLAEIRKNSRRILTRFGSEIDSAFLAHRALSLPDEDASEHLLPVLSSEIEAVLEDCMNDDKKLTINNDELLRNWCHAWTPAQHSSGFAGGKEKAKEFSIPFVTKGPDCVSEFPKSRDYKDFIQIGKHKSVWNIGKVRNLKSISRFLLPKDDDAESIQLAQLLSHRTQYTEVRTLRFGAIVRLNSKDEPDYLLCIQPTCDGVRLSQETTFPFLRLSIETNENLNSSLSVIDNGEIVRLRTRYKPSNIVSDVFTPMQRYRKIVSGLDGNGDYVFKAASGLEYYWLAELRFEHAQREVARLAAEMSRVGLTESEWQRLLSRA